MVSTINIFTFKHSEHTPTPSLSQRSNYNTIRKQAELDKKGQQTHNFSLARHHQCYNSNALHSVTISQNAMPVQ